MCRLAAWLGESLAIEELLCKPRHSLISQSICSLEAKLEVNSDGFGLAWYNSLGKLGLYRDVLPAWADTNLHCLASMIHAHVFIAHVRAATVGTVARSNCHPFVCNDWSFAHNGKIGGFYKNRRYLENLLSNKLYSEKQGTTDSELLFLLMLEFGLQRNVPEAVSKIVKLTSDTARVRDATRIAAVFSNGKNLYALRYSSDKKSPSLYYCQVEGKGLVVSSEPLDPNFGKFQLVPESTLLIANDTGTSLHPIEH